MGVAANRDGLSRRPMRKRSIRFVAVVEDAFFAEEVFPEHIFVAGHGDEVGVGEIFAAGVKAEADVIFVVDAFLFFVDVEQEGLEMLGRRCRGFVFVAKWIEITGVCGLGLARYLVPSFRAVSLSQAGASSPTYRRRYLAPGFRPVRWIDE